MSKGMFATEIDGVVIGGHKGLAGTAQLTGMANQLANNMIRQIGEAEEEYRERFEASQVDHNAMDALINDLVQLDELDVTFLEELDEGILEAMLKSQQSKRSRSKSKVMTFDNYRNLMAGAICELLIRKVLGKPKSATGYRRAAGTIEYTADELEFYKEDQEALKREIRNVQSKKSIAKSKPGFSEEDDLWQRLLAAEASLKEIRIAAGPRTVVVDKTGEQLKAELGDQDIDSLKAADAKALLKRLLEQASGDAATA